MSVLDWLKNERKVYDEDGFDQDGFNRLGFDRNGFDREGYDVQGYNLEGFNRKGINRKTGRDKEGYDEDGFDEYGFDRNGFDRQGYDRMGYTVDGFDRYGFNIDGFDKDGFDKAGYSKDGFDREGYNRSGFNILGFDRDGYDVSGFDKHGYDRDGYDNNGFDANGYNRSGFDQSGYDKYGFDINGYDRQGYDRDGYDQQGFNAFGYDRDGYDEDGFNENGFNREGYDKDGFDLNGYDKNGLDRSGYDKNGYDKDGYDKSGFNRTGYDREGYNRAGYNKQGYDRAGYNKKGYNKDGYDTEGYDVKGFNKDGFTRTGLNIKEFDENGYHIITKLDAFGYNKYGFNINGINKYTKKDRLGFNGQGLDINGYDIWGINEDTNEDRFGNPINEVVEKNTFTEQACSDFRDMYYKFMGGDFKLAHDLSDCFYYGKGTVRDYRKALLVLLDAACEYNDLEVIGDLADHFYVGECVRTNIQLFKYFRDIADSKTPKSMNQYKAREALSRDRKPYRYDPVLKEEEEHLKKIVAHLSKKIKKYEDDIIELDNDTSWMDRDQRLSWVEDRAANSWTYSQIEELEALRKRPYYARMDTKFRNGTERSYIGESGYTDFRGGVVIYSVWSDYGKEFRNNRSFSFSLRGETYEVLLRRKFLIEDGRLVEYYDEYQKDSEASRADITDPYLLRILEEKRGEKNITNIIRTIQTKQNDVIEEDFEKNIIVQGCAGSGKTMILLHRLANLKYNNPKFEWEKVKIISPNKDFNLFIDELSKNLKIDEIEKLTLAEYYIDLLWLYAEEVRKRRVIDSTVRDKDNNERRYNRKNEIRKIKHDKEWKRNYAEYLYSNEFRSLIEKRCKKNKNRLQKSFYEILSEADEEILNAIKSKFDKGPKNLSNYLSVLYARVLYAYLLLGPVNNAIKMLCIDEGQDICENQYRLLFDVTGKNTYINIYGDLAQRISDNISITDWKSVASFLNAKKYTLNENFRNSNEIISFYNRVLKKRKKDQALGISTKNVERFKKQDLEILVRLQLLLKNRTVIIAKELNDIPLNIRIMCVEGGIAEGYVSAMDIAQVKGLEFDTAFVFDEKLDSSEKYIAYTRALSELYIQSENVFTYALGIVDQ